MMADSTEVSCTLTSLQQRARHAHVKDTIIPMVCSVTRADGLLRIEFTEPENIRELVEEFVTLERQCCSFLSFSISETDGRLTVVIQGAPESEHMLDLFFQSLRARNQ